METYLGFAPRGLTSFLAAMPVWLNEKLFMKREIRNALSDLSGIDVADLPELLFTEHHHSHAASAFFPSPFARAAVLCMDGVGEWATTSVWLGEDNRLTPQWQINFPHSLGLLYSAFTYYTGFRVNSGEYKVMGLAPYGEPKYVDTILNELVDLREDGSFHLNMRYFGFATGLRMTNAKFDALLGGPPRQPESPLTQREMDLARSIQEVTDLAVLRLARTVKKELGVDYLCLAGGVALNCVANGRLLREGIFKDLWIQPAAGDAGGALGAALVGWYEYLDKPRTKELLIQENGAGNDAMRGSFLGPRAEDGEIKTFLDRMGAPHERLDDDVLMPRLAEILESGAVVGWVQGRMEFGPRALGSRSILGDPRNTKMQSVMNLKIKYRESFRPFAPAVLAEKVSAWFEIDRRSPYMLLVAPLKSELRIPMTGDQDRLFGIDKLNVPRSAIPAVTHIDYSARIQTVHKDTNPRFHKLIETFYARSACPILVNTSFNVRGEPIVCTPEDAYRCFMRTEMDYLVIEQYLIAKERQPKRAADEAWKKEFELD